MRVRVGSSSKDATRSATAVKIPYSISRVKYVPLRNPDRCHHKERECPRTGHLSSTTRRGADYAVGLR